MDTLRVETIGHIPAKTGVIHTRFPFDGFGLVLRGAGFYRVDKGPVRRIQSPAVFFVWPGPLFHYGPEPGSSWEERYLCFSGLRVADWLRWRWLPRLDRFQALKEPEVLDQMHRRICRAFSPFNSLSLDQAKLEIEQLVYELYRQTASHAVKDDRLAVLIQRWSREPLLAGDLRAAAKKLGMSYSGFRQHFASRTGLAPHQFLLRLRIDQACLRLSQTNDPVKSIAGDSGFAFVESFNRAFRQIKGLTPGEYRRRMRLLSRHSPRVKTGLKPKSVHSKTSRR
ncbi:MAG: AraC family transcriptional regulator [Methylacidiphilales bacterium]|nr:AraC family transcriptional regulator [Candidatus Methylacidiphilales bacterium]